MSQKHAQKKEYCVLLDKNLVSDFDKAIFPYKRSNVIHELILEFLADKKRGSGYSSNPNPKQKILKMTGQEVSS